MTLPLSLEVDSLGPFFDARHGALVARLREILVEPLGHDPAHVAQALGQRLGLYAHLVPERHGGAPAGKPEDSKFVDVRALVLVREALAQVSPMADAIFAVQGLGSYPVSAFGTPAQRERVLPGVISGERIGAFALTEPEAGSDVASLRTTARRDGDGWVLEGDKTLISNVGIAHHYVVFANVDPAAGRRGITAFLVPADAPNLTFEPLALTSPHPLGRLRFSGVRVGAGDLIGEPGKGFGIAMETLDTFRISVGAAANGMARRALDLALHHVKSRRQFGGPLADREQIQGYLADMATELDAARLLVARAAHKRDGGARVTREAAMAKMFATEAGSRIVDKAVQLHGGSGVLLGAEVEALYRDIRPLRIYEGTTEIQRLVIAKSLLA
ncbi:MAG: acyl-CoA dehydrogenase family protein [Polyangiaceae bacterium]